MPTTNAEIVRGYIELINAHNLDRFYDYIDKKCVSHSAPYVGLGVRYDEKPDQKLVIVEVSKKGPSDGKLMVGDELVRIQNENGVADTFDQMKTGFFGLGQVGYPVNITVRRGDDLLDFTVIRSRIEGFDLVMNDDVFESYRKFLMETSPDYKADIKVMFEEGDKVACYLILSGTNVEYHASAVWPSCEIHRVENGKIVESWWVEDNLSWHLQMGYQMQAPLKQKA